MKSVYLTNDHAIFRQNVRQFMEKEVAPFAEQWESDTRIPAEIWRKMGEQGYLGILFPESLGGTGADIFYAIVFLEELARSRMGGFCAAVSVQQFIATGAISHQGSDALKERYVRPSILGQKVGAISISEPDTGSDVAAITTTATRDQGQWVINGAKTWVTNGVYADFYVIACKTDREAGAAGISLIVVDAGTPGLKARKLKKMGWHSSDTAELSLENVRVPESNLVGAENMGFYFIMQTFVLERLTVAATSIGSANVSLQDTVKYMEERQAFGRPILKFQALRHRLADLFAELEAVRQLTYHAAWLMEQKESAVREASMAKLLASEFSKKAIDECVQFHGGFGYVEEYAVARAYRDARVGTIVAGTSEIMREIICKTDLDGMEFPTTLPDQPTANTKSDKKSGGSGEVPAAGIAGLMGSLPDRLREDKTEGWKSVFHFVFTDSAHPEWTVQIDSARCEVLKGLHGAPDCVVKSSEETFLAVEQGRKNPQMAVLSGKLKISNIAAMTRFMKSFRKIG